MNSENKINRAKIMLQSRNPFFSYLSLFANFREDKEKRLSKNAGMGINARGDCVYNDKFVQKLTDEETMFVVCHEIMHLALLHLNRLGTREMEIWNIVTDLAVNTFLRQNNFQVIKGGIIATENDNITFILPNNKKLIIKNVSTKTAEMLYDEIPEFPKHKGKGFDFHDFDKGKSEEEKTKAENEWKNRIEEAYTYAKMKGNEPLGIDRFLGEIHKSQINWKSLLQRYLVSSFPTDYTWAKRNKKSIAIDSYLPDTKGEKIEVVIGIDASGSIGQEELGEFLGEIIGLSKAYQEQVSMRVLCHDVDVHTDYEVANGNIEKIKKIQIKGGGGTSHKPLLEHIKNKIKKCKVLISFTDGCSDLENIKLNDYKFKKIFVISKNGQKPNINETMIKVK